MNLSHFGAIVWLRWRLLVNRINRLTPLSRGFHFFLLATSCLLGVSSFLVMLSAGGRLLPPTWAPSQTQLWNGLILVFAGFFLGSAVTGFQRDSGLALKKFLPLPMSPAGAYLLNVFSLLLVPSVIALLPSMIALCLLLAWNWGPRMLLSLPLLFCFIAMMAALSMQLRTWLANQIRHRSGRWLLLGIGISIGLSLLGGLGLVAARVEAKSREIIPELDPDFVAKRRQLLANEFSQVVRPAGHVVPYLPPFWLAIGIEGLGRREYWQALAAAGGMLAVMAVSLRQGYRRALRLSRFAESAGWPFKKWRDDRTALERSASSRPARAVRNWIDIELGWLTPRVAAVALLTLRNESRAFEWVWRALVALVLGIGLYWCRGNWPLAEWLHPWLALGISWALINLSWDGSASDFTSDGTGFRALLLAPLREEEILLGKNAAAFLRAVLLGGWAGLIFQFALSLSWSHFLASLFQLGSLFVVMSLTTNLLSILFPLGSKVDEISLGSLFLRLVVGRIVLIAYLPMLLPLGLEMLAEQAGFVRGVPIYLLGAAGYFLILALLYRPAIGWQADLLRRRKYRVLEMVTSRGN